MTATDRRYAECLLVGHRYRTDRFVWRTHSGHTVPVRVCLHCKVPEVPRLRSKQVGKPRELRSFWE